MWNRGAVGTMRSVRNGVSLAGMAALLSLATASCAVTEESPNDQVAAAASGAPDAHNSRIALDWAGTYSGVLPCADCPGIETAITLNDNGTFRRSMTYLERSVAPVVDSGTFEWQEDGNTITLQAEGDGNWQYQVGENQLIHLDGDGQRITGDLAPNYILAQHVNDPSIEGIRWKLVELRGSAVDTSVNAFFTLDAAESHASGNTSCNSFSGGYAIKTGQRINFARNMAVTMRACMDMNVEAEFLEVLKTADNYSLGNGTLSLNKARMAPLARFEQVEEG